MRNPRVLQMTVPAYAYADFVSREKHEQAYDELQSFRQRAKEHSDWYSKNTTIVSAYDYLSKVFEAWLKR